MENKLTLNDVKNIDLKNINMQDLTLGKLKKLLMLSLASITISILFFSVALIVLIIGSIISVTELILIIKLWDTINMLFKTSILIICTVLNMFVYKIFKNAVLLLKVDIVFIVKLFKEFKLRK